MIRWIYLLSLCLIGCSAADDTVPKPSSFDDLRHATARTVIDLTASEVQALRPNMVIGGAVGDGPGDVLGQPTSTTRSGDRLVIADRSGGRLMLASQQGELVSTYGQLGEGPGEFVLVDQVVSNQDYLFVLDTGNHRLQIFDHALDYIDALNVRSPGFVHATDDYLFLSANQADAGAVAVHAAYPPFEKQFDFLPLVVPQSVRPSGYNLVRSASDSNGNLAFHYFGLPYLFLFDNGLEHNITIEFTANFIEEIVASNPPPEPLETSEDVRISMIFGPLALHDDGRIFIAHRRTLYVIGRCQRDYELITALQFDASAVDERYSQPLGLYHVMLDGNDIYLSSIHYPHVFQFELNDHTAGC